AAPAEGRRLGARPRRRRRLQAAQLDDAPDGGRAGGRDDRRPQARRPVGGPARDPPPRGALGGRARAGRGRAAREGRRRARPAGGSRRPAGDARARAPARAARVADRPRPRRPDVPRRGRRLGRGRGQADRDDRRGRAAHALPRADPARPGAGRLPGHPRRPGAEAAGGHAGRGAGAALRRGRPRHPARRARARADAVRIALRAATTPSPAPSIPSLERKLATVLFVDLVDSTALVVGADPEVVRRRVGEYFERAAQCIEQHGGTVEKFAGDAVMAAFGVPRTHEDDAARAVRAAFEILPQVRDLGLEARMGIEAGEVVVDQADSTFVTGEAVNIAARLQQAAGPGEIVLGPAVRRLTAGFVEVEDRGPLELKGRPEPIWTWRAVCSLDAPRRRSAAWFVGREQELELLHNALARAMRDRRAQLVTVYGDAGVGKSRLVHEFTEGVERATVLLGRALPYGESVTYAPLASMIKSSAGITDDAPAAEAFERLRSCCESEAVADLLAVALGVLGATDDGHGPG